MTSVSMSLRVSAQNGGWPSKGPKEDRAERVHIDARPEGWCVLPYFGSHVAWRSRHHPCLRYRRHSRELGKAEVEEANAPVVEDEYVAWLEIPVQNASGVGSFERLDDGEQHWKQASRIDLASTASR